MLLYSRWVLFLNSIKTFETNRWYGFGNSTYNYTEAFLLNMMGSVTQILKYFDQVNAFEKHFDSQTNMTMP